MILNKLLLLTFIIINRCKYEMSEDEYNATVKLLDNVLKENMEDALNRGELVSAAGLPMFSSPNKKDGGR